jgi:hypothetical protein
MPTISPKIVVFFLYDSTTGAPLAGQTPTFSTYKDDTGTNLTQPVISEIGGGAYKFTPTFPSGRGIAFAISSGSANALPAYQVGYLRPEDYFVDDIAILKQIETGKWQIHTSGPEANRLVIYDADGTTVLYRFDLADSSGAATTVAPFRRTPV